MCIVARNALSKQRCQGCVLRVLLVSEMAFLAGFLVDSAALGQDVTKFIGIDEHGALSVTVAPPGTPAIKINKEAPPIEFGWTPERDPDCGANALYLFLALRGVPISREKAHQEVPTTGEGASLLDLKRACERYGVAAKAYELSPERLRSLRLPVIARMAARDSASAHYVLVTSVRDDDIDLVDGTTGEHILVAKWAFAQDFTGHVLGQAGPSRTLLWVGVAILIVEVTGALFLLRRRWLIA